MCRDILSGISLVLLKDLWDKSPRGARTEGAFVHILLTLESLSLSTAVLIKKNEQNKNNFKRKLKGVAGKGTGGQVR